MIVTTLDTFTSLLSGFTIFGILGNLAYELNNDDISTVIGTGGTSLAFISYPDAIAKSPVVPQVSKVYRKSFLDKKIIEKVFEQFIASSIKIII